MSESANELVLTFCCRHYSYSYIYNEILFECSF